MGMCLGTFPCCLVTENCSLVSDFVILCENGIIIQRVKES